MCPAMKSPQTTITVSQEVKDVLAQAKGNRSWEDFLREVALHYADEAIALAELRLKELRAHKARGLSLDDVAALRKPRAGGLKLDGKRSVAARRPSRGSK